MRRSYKPPSNKQNILSNQLSGYLIIIGSILFFIAASVVSSIYQETDIDVIVQTVEDNWNMFLLSQFCFALGGIVTAIGFSLFSFQMRHDDKVSNLEVWASSLSILLGSILWAIHVVMRTIDTRKYFLTSDTTLKPITQFVIIPLLYIILTIISFVIFAIMFYQLSYPLWMGIMLFLVSFVSLILIIVIGGAFPPVFYYIFTLAIGLRFIRM